MLALGAPVLLFPSLVPSLTAGALLLLVSWWLARWWAERAPLPTTPLNGALLLWGLALLTGIAVTAYPAVTLPKATGLILGLASWRALVLVVQDRRLLRWAAAGLGLTGLGMATVGLLSVNWSTKVPMLAPLLARLPEALLSLPGSPERGINANQLAGALTFYLPLTLAWLAAALFPPSPSPAVSPPPPPQLPRFFRLAVAALTCLLTFALLLLTQSRSGWIGGAAGVLALPVLWGFATPRRWGRRLAGGMLILALAAGLVLLLVVDLEALAPLWQAPGGVETEVGTLSISGRVEIWSRALYAIQDFPFTGCGLGTFREVVWLLYPLFTIPPTTDFAHAHNVFLQVAVDVGLPGLIAYLALLGVAGVLAWRVARADAGLRPLALGLLAGLVALHTYGLTDALAPGSKPALVVWIALGLLAAMDRLAVPAPARVPDG